MKIVFVGPVGPDLVEKCCFTKDTAVQILPCLSKLTCSNLT